MSNYPNLELVSLKKNEFMPPEVYPQKVQQKEDEMSENNVKSGFVYRKPVPDEYETSKEDVKSIDKDAIWNLYYNILSRKFACSKVSESKSNQIVAARVNSVEKPKIFPSSNFIKDLAGNTPLYVFARKPPPINFKKEDVLNDLVKYKVPLSKAVWYINRGIQATSTTIETVRKKQRTNADYPAEWHTKICDLLTTLLKSESFLLDSSLDDFDYLFNILLYLYDANTADHWEVLTWIFDTLTGIYSPFAAESEIDQLKPLTLSLQDNKHLQFFLPYLLSFGRRFTESEVIVRKVLVWCCATFSQLVTSDKTIPLDSSDASFRSLLKDYKLLTSCPQHRCLIFSLTTLITALAVSCPSACVWSRPSSTCDSTVSVNFSYLYSSPLDYLPCPLVALALPPGPENLVFRQCLLQTEEAIIKRSQLVENGWALMHKTSVPQDIELLVQIVRLLDKHEFSSVSYQGLVRQILALLTNNATQLPALLRLLCDWAVTPYRVGMFRAVVIACMIEDIKGQVSDVPSDELSNLIQTTLVDYLANQAPTLHDSSSLQYATVEQDASFRSLICLFAELIDRQLFDYGAYIHYCIALGHVDSSMHPLATENNSHLNIIPRNLDEDNLGSNEGPDSVRSDFGLKMPIPGHPRASLLRQNRHLEYLCHFPLPQDDSYSSEINQRAQLMFGTGRVRERIKSDLKKFVREICRLFNRKTVDVVNGEIGRKRKVKERLMDPITGMPIRTPPGQMEDCRSFDDNHDEYIVRFKTLSYFDMEFVVSQSVAPFLKAMQGQQPAPGTVLAGRIMPVPSVVCLMFDLVEISLNIGSLLQLVTDTLAFLRPLQELRQSKTAALYRSNLCTRGVGILRKYQPVLVTMPELVPKILDSLFPKLNLYRNISQVSPIDRCLLLNFEELQKAAPQMTTQIPKVSNQRYGRQDGAEPCYKPDLIPEISQLFNEITIQKFIEQMNVSIDIRYTFVIKSILYVVRANSPETVQNACELCTCVTAQCEYLTLEWLLAFKTLLICPERSGGPHLYPDLLRVELNDMAAYDNLATLIGTLLTYNYFTLMDFLQRVFNPALAVITQPSVESVENRARFACFILHRIFSWSNHSMLGVLQHQDPGPLDNHFGSANWSQSKISEPLLLYAMLQREPTSTLIDAIKLMTIISSSRNQAVTEEQLMANPCWVDLEECLSANLEEEDYASDDSQTGEPEANSVAEMYADEDELLGQSSSGRKRRKCTVAAASQSGSQKRRKKKEKEALGSSKRGKRALAYRFIHQATKKFLDTGQLPSDADLSTYKLCDFTQLLARQVSTTEWVRRYFSSCSAKFLFEGHVLKDRLLTEPDARRVLHVMFWPRDLTWVDVATNDTVNAAMVSVLNNLNFWTVDYSYLEFRMLLNHIPSMNQERILETVANSLIKRVQQQTLNWVSYDSEPYSGLPTHVEFSPNDPAWLLPCIVSQFKLLKNHIAKQACEMLKSIKSFTRMRNVEEKERNLLQNTAILAHGPFFALLKQCLLECLDFPDTVNEQIEAFIQDVKEVQDRVPDNLPTRHIIHECLTLRLVLIGHRMTLCSESEFAFRWVPTLAQLIIYGLCDVDSNEGLYFMVLDMLNNLLHILLERFGPTSKNYLGVIKKIRKEIADRPATVGVELIRPFLLVSKNAPNTYLYTVTSLSGDQKKSKSGGDSGKPKSALSAGNDNSVGPGIKGYSRKHGYLVTKRDAAGQAEIHDNSKQHLLYSMYGAVFCEETLNPSFELADANLLLNHEHFTYLRRHSNSFYLEPPLGSRLNLALDKLSERTARMEAAVAAAAAKPPEVKLEPDSGGKGMARPNKPAPPTSLLMLANRAEYLPASATMGGLLSPMGCGKVPFSQTIGAQHPYSGLISPNRALPLTPRALTARSSVESFSQMRPMSSAQNSNRGSGRPVNPQDPCQARPPLRTVAGPMAFHQMAPGSMPPNRMPNPAITDFSGMMQAQQHQPLKASHGPGRPPGSTASSTTKRKKSQSRNKTPAKGGTSVGPPGMPPSAVSADAYTFSGANSNSGGSLSGWGGNESMAPNEMAMQDPSMRPMGPGGAGKDALSEMMMKRRIRNTQPPMNRNPGPGMFPGADQGLYHHQPQAQQQQQQPPQYMSQDQMQMRGAMYGGARPATQQPGPPLMQQMMSQQQRQMMSSNAVIPPQQQTAGQFYGQQQQQPQQHMYQQQQQQSRPPEQMMDYSGVRPQQPVRGQSQPQMPNPNAQSMYPPAYHSESYPPGQY